MESSKKLEILEKSLIKKELLFDQKIGVHFDSVKQANGQPMNDKRNGQATLNKWEKQNDSLRTLKKSIEKTKEAIEVEKGKIKGVEYVNGSIPKEILSLVESKELTQWRKYPNMFFVTGVDKARIIYDFKTNKIGHKYFSAVTDLEQCKMFVNTFKKIKLLIGQI